MENMPQKKQRNLQGEKRLEKKERLTRRRVDQLIKSKKKQ